MATTALEPKAAPVPVECYRNKLQELANLIIHNSSRYRRIALCHLGNAADADDALQDALLSALTHVEQVRGESENVHLAYRNRNQFCSDEATSTFVPRAIDFG